MADLDPQRRTFFLRIVPLGLGLLVAGDDVRDIAVLAPTENWLFANLCDKAQFGCRTRMPLRWSLARPYIWRLRCFS